MSVRASTSEADSSANIGDIDRNRLPNLTGDANHANGPIPYVRLLTILT